MTYKSNYNNLYGTAKYLLSNDQVMFLSAAWQKRWWDLTFPRNFSDFIPKVWYDVAIDQYNLSGSWLYTGASNHSIKAGLNLDYTKAKYNVNTPRILHQLIAEGSTNLEDHWGPVTGDSGISANDTAFQFNNAGNLVSRLLVDYKGARNFISGGIFGQDEWSITPRLTLDIGARIEASMADTSVTVSPRVSAKFSLFDNIELLGAVGHYTQNNYEVAALALSNSLRPEKVWHASVGSEIRLLPWLTDKVDVYGKYYYDLISENVTQRQISAEHFPAFTDSSLRTRYGNTYIDSLQGTEGYGNLATSFMLSNALYESHFTNDGAGYSLGFENFLRYDPTSFWYGWVSFSFGTSVRKRHPGWRWYPFSLDRPLLFSLVNYYRLPRKFEIGVKYRYMSGIPYTPVENNSNGFSVGPSNSRRYMPYHRLDFRISKGFNLFTSRGNFYVEVWNAFNSPNSMLRDSRTNDIKSIDLNIPITVLFLGLDFSL
jgi:outer membrane receptor protein involved in Fe transport